MAEGPEKVQVLTMEWGGKRKWGNESAPSTLNRAVYQSVSSSRNLQYATKEVQGNSSEKDQGKGEMGAWP